MTSAGNPLTYGLASTIFGKSQKARAKNVTSVQKGQESSERFIPILMFGGIVVNAIMGGYAAYDFSRGGADGFMMFGVDISSSAILLFTFGGLIFATLGCILPATRRPKGWLAALWHRLAVWFTVVYSAATTALFVLAIIARTDMTTDQAEMQATDRVEIIRSLTENRDDARDALKIIVADVEGMQSEAIRARQSVAEAENDYRIWEAQVALQFPEGSAAKNRRDAASYPVRVRLRDAIQTARDDYAATRATLEEREAEAEAARVVASKAQSILIDARSRQGARQTDASGFAMAYSTLGNATGIDPSKWAVFFAILLTSAFSMSPVLYNMGRGLDASRMERDAEKVTRGVRRKASRASRPGFLRRMFGKNSAPPAPRPDPVTQASIPPAPETPILYALHPAPPPQDASQDTAVSDRPVRTAAVYPGPRSLPANDALVIAAEDGIKDGSIGRGGANAISRYLGVGNPKGQRVQAALIEKGVLERTPTGARIV